MRVFIKTFLRGIVAASMMYFYIQARYEDSLFRAIKKSTQRLVTKTGHSSQLAMCIASNSVCHHIMANRESIFSSSKFRVSFLHSVSDDLMTTQGACGSYSMVLARLLQEFDIPVRIAQMRVNGVWAAHNVVEAKPASRWIVMDPTYDLVFTMPDSVIANFADVQRCWNYYRHQVPRGYDSTYTYEDVRYTNWEKIPIISPVTKKMLDWCIGKKEADTVSMRIYFLKEYKIAFWLCFLVWVIDILILIAINLKFLYVLKKLRIQKKSQEKAENA